MHQPIILAVDTSTEACSVALGMADETLCRYEVEPRKHTELALPMVQALMAEAGLSLQALDAIAFVRGPGAFTGLRIAAGLVQGMAVGLDIPVISISSLAAIAHRAYREQGCQAVHAAIDARMGEVYWGSYRVSGWGWAELVGKEVVCAPSAVIENAGLPDELCVQSVAPTADVWAGCGTGWIHENSLQQQLANVQAVWVDCYPHGTDVVALARAAWQRGELISAEQAQPVYLRDNVVQVRST